MNTHNTAYKKFLLLNIQYEDSTAIILGKLHTDALKAAV
jgi:hypothetical protein